MRTFTLDGSSDVYTLTDRPTHADYVPLPHGLTLADAVAVRAHQVDEGDLVVASSLGGTDRLRRAVHVPGPYLADPNSVAGCACQKCETCDVLNEWSSGEDRPFVRRFVCLAPAGGGQPCAIVGLARIMAVIPAHVVQEALPWHTVTWSCNFQATSAQEAAHLAYEQLKTYGTDAHPPVLKVTGPDGDDSPTVFDLFQGTAERR
ncbi:hypothetical protein [Streptomyces sp. MBT27]|uniref:hypothetical protein n=1 Tax=Streptomyces sp. MBT27 TaxID=1488356 RepID=UPI001420AF84|nr:hypothetical protein [Streptomyces sp. MBT27]